jgi:3-oxoacid CoA-transferase B subunit
MAGERLDEQTMAIRAAKEFQDGMVINLGVGIPTYCSNFVPPEREVLFHSENGVIGFGAIVDNPDDADDTLINAGAQPISSKPGMAITDHAESLCIIRGVVQVSEKGDLANYVIPGKQIGSLGGGQDLAFCAKKVIALTTFSTKEGQPKVVKECTQPLTAPRSVDQIITDIAVLDVTPEGLVLRELVPGWTAEEVQALTDAKIIVPPDVEEMTLL